MPTKKATVRPPAAFTFVARPSRGGWTAKSAWDIPGVRSISGYITGVRPHGLRVRFVAYDVHQWVPALHKKFANGLFLYRFMVSARPKKGYTRVLLEEQNYRDNCWTYVRTQRWPHGESYDAPCDTVLLWLLGLPAEAQLPKRMWVRLTRSRVPVASRAKRGIR
jgi:hypothetical protein